MTEECPKASTSEYLFVRAPDMIGYHEIIRLPLLSQAKEWLGTIAKEVHLTNGLEGIELTNSLSLPEFRRKVSSSQGSYSRVEQYMLSVVLYVILLGAFVYMIYFFRRKFKKNSRYKMETMLSTSITWRLGNPLRKVDLITYSFLED